MAQVKVAAIDGAAIFVGQVATRKIRGAVTGMLPDATKASVQSGAGLIALNLASAIALTVAAHKFGKNYARAIAGGAFAEVISSAVNQTSMASYLGAFAPIRRTNRIRGAGVSAWPNRGAIGAPGMAAWPAMGMPTTVGN